MHNSMLLTFRAAQPSRQCASLGRRAGRKLQYETLQLRRGVEWRSFATEASVPPAEENSAGSTASLASMIWPHSVE